MNELAQQADQSVACARRQFVRIAQVETGGGQRRLRAARMAAHGFQRLCAKAALGLIVDPFECQIVSRLGNGAQIGERVSDLGTFVEAEAAHNAIVEADLDEAVFEFARLILCANENGDLVQRSAFGFQPLYLFAHAARFFGRIPDADNPDLFAGRQFGPQRLAEPFAIGVDKSRCRGKNLRRGAVVLFKLDHSCARKILFKLEDIGDFCAAP